MNKIVNENRTDFVILLFYRKKLLTNYFFSVFNVILGLRCRTKFA